MKAAPNASKAVTVQLDGPRTITYNKLAVYQMGTLKRPSTTQDLLNDEKSFSALVQWLWACMSGKDALRFPTPESLLPYVEEEAITALFVAFYETWKAAQPPEAESPLPSGSTTGPLPSSS